MSNASGSLVGFGRLLNTLTGILTDGCPISAALDVVREHFAAQIVLLGITARGEEPHFVTNDAYGPLGAGTSPCDRAAMLRAMTKRFQHIAVTEPGSQESADYALWIFRDRETARFDAEETDLAGIVLAQIARALNLASRIDSDSIEKAIYSSVLQRLHVGVVIVDKQGRTSRASAVAGLILSKRDGLQIQAGRLRATNAVEDRALQAAIRAALQDVATGNVTNTRGLSLTKCSGARTLGVVICPVAGPAGAGPVAAVYVRDCDEALGVESDIVRQIFDLTPAEAAVTHRLAAGLSLEDAAASLAISRNTARAHLRSIFSKSGITRQTELVRLVLNSAVVLGETSREAA